MPSAFRASRDVIIRTEAFAEAVQFYEATLGLAVVHRSDTLVGFDTGSFRLYVEPGPRHGPVFEFHVPDLQDARRALLSAGCAIVEEDASVPRCYIRDPHGLAFNIHQDAGTE
jgi:predicted enzyme related to lactoylglutathione lyase